MRTAGEYQDLCTFHKGLGFHLNPPVIDEVWKLYINVAESFVIESLLDQFDALAVVMLQLIRHDITFLKYSSKRANRYRKMPFVFVLQ